MDKIKQTIDAIERVDFSLAEETQKRLDNLTKPQGSLGRLEELAKQEKIVLDKCEDYLGLRRQLPDQPGRPDGRGVLEAHGRQAHHLRPNGLEQFCDALRHAPAAEHQVGDLDGVSLRNVAGQGRQGNARRAPALKLNLNVGHGQQQNLHGVTFFEFRSSGDIIPNSADVKLISIRRVPPSPEPNA